MLGSRQTRRASLGVGIGVLTGGIALCAAVWGSANQVDLALPSNPTSPVYFGNIETQPTDHGFWQNLASVLSEHDPTLELVPRSIKLDELVPSLAAGELNDVFSVPDSYVTHYASTDSLTPASAFLAGKNSPRRERFVSRLFGSLSLEGTLYGLPWRWRGTALLLHNATWEWAGLQLPPDHWRDDRWSLRVMEAVITRVRELAGDKMKAPTGFRGSFRWVDWLPWLWIGGAQLWQHAATATTLTEMAANLAMKRYAEWCTTLQAADANTSAIMMVEPSWRAVGEAIAAGRTSALPLPRGARRVTLLRSDALITAGDVAHPDGAYRAVLAVATGVGQELVAADGTGFPVWRDTLAGRTLWQQWQGAENLGRALRTFIETGTYGAVPPYPSRWPKAARVLEEELAPGFHDITAMNETLQRATDALQPVLAASRWP